MRELAVNRPTEIPSDDLPSAIDPTRLSRKGAGKVDCGKHRVSVEKTVNCISSATGLFKRARFLIPNQHKKYRLHADRK